MTLVLTAGIKLTLGKVSCYTLDAGCSAVGLARSVWDAEVGGSNPLTPTILIDINTGVLKGIRGITTLTQLLPTSPRGDSNLNLSSAKSLRQVSTTAGS